MKNAIFDDFFKLLQTITKGHLGYVDMFVSPTEVGSTPWDNICHFVRVDVRSISEKLENYENLKISCFESGLHHDITDSFEGFSRVQYVL